MLTCIAVFLFILCFEVAHMDRTLAQGNLQKVIICSADNSDRCADVTSGNRLQVKEIR
ncbi:MULTISPECIES: hypothetical protein [Okeania]|uniref:hypothetical protein n=1 Tax=Okeania TaxID=1458928 RepID=UPI001374C43B|nr:MULTISPECIES: hypothetical protein [Okeania]NET78386.1 hypothetical protein [Okeania sp. SIO1F9]